jgi:4'-phosphopantetheinyl transferase
MMRRLSRREIHVYLTSPEGIPSGLQDQYRGLLSAEERALEGGYRLEADRRRFVVTRALLRTVLSRYAPVAPEDWAFVKNRFGRPRIADTVQLGSRPVFNISHTREMIVLAICADRELGIDVENIHTHVIAGLAERFFAAPEVAALADITGPRRQEAFFEYWTLKESYLKARGLGLSAPLDQFSFRFPGKTRIQLHFTPTFEDDARRWLFWQFRPVPEYLVAVCAENTTVDRPAVTVTRIVPQASERPLNIQFARVSA